MLPNLRAHVVCSSRQQGASFVQKRARSNRALRRSGAMAVCTAAGGSAQDMQTMAERSGSGSIGHLFSPGPLQARSPSPPFSGESEHLKVFMMLPLDTVNADGLFRYAAVPWFSQALHLLAASGVHGVAVDVWWGAVEREPRQYHWQPYRQLFELVKSVGLKLQVVLSFHACGGNVGDTAQIPLPKWVLEAGEADPDIFFTDRPRGHGRLGQRNREYLSIWADEVPGVLAGRSPIDCYTDFMAAFKAAFYTDMGSLVEEVVVGSGPCGELRLPSYVESNGWRFPGVGEFQCYDRHALASLAAAAHRVGKPEWGYTGPHDAGHYTSHPEHTGFFSTGGSWDTPYGRFFLDWYSGSLLKHGERLLSAASQVFAWHPAQDLVHLGLVSSGCAGTGSGAVTGGGLGGSGGLGLGGASGASGSGAGGLMRSLVSLGCRGPFSGSHAFMSSRMSYAGSTSLGGQPLLSPIRQEQRQQQQQQAARTAAAAAEPQQQRQQERTQQDSLTLLQQPQQQTQQLQQVQQQQQQQQPAVPAQQPRTSGSGGSGSGGGGLLQSLATMAAALPGPLRAAAMHHLNKSLGGGSGSGGRNSGVSSSGSSSKSNYEGDMLASGDTCTAEMQLDPDVAGAVRIRSTSGGTAMEGSEASLSVGSANTHSTASTAATTTTTTTASPMHRSSSQNCQPASPLGGTTAGSTSNSDPFTSHSSLNLDAFSTGGTASSQPGHHHHHHEHHHEHYNERHHEGDREKDAARGMPAMVAMYGDVANALVGGEDGGSQGSIAGSIIGSDVGVSRSGSGTQGDLAALGSQRVGHSSNGSADADNLDADLDSLGPMVCRGGSNPHLMAGALGAAPGRQRWPDSNSGSGGGPLATMQQHLAQLVQRASGSSNGAARAGEARPSSAASQQQQQQQLDSSESAAQLDAAALSGLGNAFGGLLSGVAGLGVGGINALGLGGSGAPPRGASCPELTHAAALAAAAAAAAAAANNNGSVSSPGLSPPPSGPNGSGGTISNNAMLGSVGAGAAAFPAYGGGGGPVALTLKIAGIHWWYHTSSHAAELTAGYYNAGSIDGYAAIVELCARHRVSLILTCVEMCDAQHPPDAACGPEGLLKQVRSLAARAGVPLGGENALPIFLANGIDATALERIVANTQASPTQPSGLAASLGAGGQLQQHQASYGGGGNGNCASIGSAPLHSAPPSLLMSSSSFGGNMALGASTYSAGGGGGMGAGLQMGDVARSGSFGRASSCGQASPANSVSMLLGGQLGSLGSMFNALTGGVGGGGNGNNNTGSGYLPAGSNANACLPSNGSLTRISGEYTQFSAAAIANGGSVVCGGAGHRTPSFSSSPARNNIVALPRCVSLFQQTSLQQLGQLGGQLGQQQQLPATALSDGAGPQSGGNSAWDCYSGMVSMPSPVASGAGTSSAAAAAGLHGGYYYPGGVVASSGISGVGIISGNNGGGGAAGVNGLTSPGPAGNGLWQQQLQQQALYYQYASHHPNGCGSAGNLGCSSAGGPGGGGSGSGGGSNGGPGLAYGPGQYPGLRCFTFLRLGPEILQPHYQAMWVKFMHSLARNSSNAVAAARMGGGGSGCMPGGGGGMYGGAYGGSGRIHTTLQ